MKIVERFIKYVKVNTTSSSHSKSVPSTLIQLELAEMLYEELRDLGLEARLDQGYVYATLKSNIDSPTTTVGFIAHMDTAPDFNGENVNPRIIEKWDGSDIVLNNIRKISLKEFDNMKCMVGEDLIVTDGNSLLGADDKAGIAIIMDTIEHLVSNPNIKHGDIKICFTPDEEIGRGADHFDVEYFNADFAYTLDGGFANEFCYETFNAYDMDVSIKGISIHPGSAKDKLVNAISVANKFDNLLPKLMRPEYTEKKEGFNHLHGINGSAESCYMHYIIRNHDAKIIQEQIDEFTKIKDKLNKELGYDAIEVKSTLSYRNMYEELHDKKEILDIAINAIRSVGLKEDIISARGGTDGSRLTFMGLLCPNLGTGSTNAHGPFETCSINQMNKMKEIVLKVIDAVKDMKL